MTQYKLQEDFDFMDKLKSDIINTLKNQEDVTKQMMKLVLGNKQNNKDKIIIDKQLINSNKSDDLVIPVELTEI